MSFSRLPQVVLLATLTPLGALGSCEAAEADEPPQASATDVSAVSGEGQAPAGDGLPIQGRPRNQNQQSLPRGPADAESFHGSETPGTGDAQLPPELRAIQESLGGSALQQFPALQPARPPRAAWWQQFHGDLASGGAAAPDAAPPAPAQPPASGDQPAVSSEFAASAAFHAAGAFNAPPLSEGDVRSGRRIAALRVVAAQLDVTANRLEELELYGHGDALRQLGQHLRLDARRMSNARAVTPGPTAHGPVDGSGDGPPHEHYWPLSTDSSSSPTGAPSPGAAWAEDADDVGGNDAGVHDRERSVLTDPRAQ